MIFITTILPFFYCSLFFVSIQQKVEVKSFALQRSRNRQSLDYSSSSSCGGLVGGSRPSAAVVVVASSNNNNIDGGSLDDESSEERKERMKLVRQLQESFYKSEIDTDDFCVPNNKDDDDILEHVPLFRVQWTELPGYQNVLNIHVPHYTHMFRRILSRPKPWRFGHVLLPGGSENLENERYLLSSKSTNKKYRIGTLMEISDVIEDESSGHLQMIVQALDRRFEVITATQDIPYAIANVRLLRDREDDDDDALLVEEEWNEWEVRPTTFPSDDETIGISPLINYNSQFYPNELALFDNDSSSSTTMVDDAANNQKKKIEDLEYNVWVALDDMLRLLAQISNGTVRIPVPTQLLGLLPISSNWPVTFQLETYANQLEVKDATIGTGTKSPFVRVARCSSYPSSRRTVRFSYVIWILFDSMALGKPTPTRQEVLEMKSSTQRLTAAYHYLTTINTELQKILLL